MLTYDKLSPGQRRWVTMVQFFHPEIVDTISFEEVHTFHTEFMGMRNTDPKFKVGLPNWLFKENRIGKGLYFFPAEGNIPPVEEEPEKTELGEKYDMYLYQFGLKKGLTTEPPVL